MNEIVISNIFISNAENDSRKVFLLSNCRDKMSLYIQNKYAVKSPDYVGVISAKVDNITLFSIYI
jgi:hypothetical protein